MGRLIWVVLGLTALYGGYWVVGAQAVERGAQAALATGRAEGIADAKGVTLAGFPSRFDLTLDAPRLQSADGAVAWAAPFAQVFALAYRPNEVILFAPQDQTLRLRDQEFSFFNKDMRASAAVQIGADLALNRATAVLAEPRLAPATGPALAAREVRAAVQADPALTAGYHLGLEILDLDLPPEAMPDPALPGQIARLHVDATAQLTAPLDRHAAQSRPALKMIDLRAATLDWAGLVVRAEGMIEITAAGQPEGKILLRSHDWQALLDRVAQAGLVPAERLPMLTTIGTEMASKSDDGALELPLTFRQGQMSLGPLPLGPAPFLR